MLKSWQGGIVASVALSALELTRKGLRGTWPCSAALAGGLISKSKGKFKQMAGMSCKGAVILYKETEDLILHPLVAVIFYGCGVQL